MRTQRLPCRTPTEKMSTVTVSCAFISFVLAYVPVFAKGGLARKLGKDLPGVDFSSEFAFLDMFWSSTSFSRNPASSIPVQDSSFIQFLQLSPAMHRTRC